MPPPRHGSRMPIAYPQSIQEFEVRSDDAFELLLLRITARNQFKCSSLFDFRTREYAFPHRVMHVCAHNSRIEPYRISHARLVIQSWASELRGRPMWTICAMYNYIQIKRNPLAHTHGVYHLNTFLISSSRHRIRIVALSPSRCVFFSLGIEGWTANDNGRSYGQSSWGL